MAYFPSLQRTGVIGSRAGMGEQGLCGREQRTPPGQPIAFSNTERAAFLVPCKKGYSRE